MALKDLRNRPLRVLVVTAMYPHKGNGTEGAFVQDQIRSLVRVNPNLKIDVLYLQGHRKAKYLLGATRVLAATIRTRYDLVHAHYGLAAMPAVFRFKAPLVITLHGSDVMIRWQRYLSRSACGFADAVIVVSEDLRKRLGRPEAAVIPAGIDLVLFRELDQAACRDVLRLTRDLPVVLFGGDPERRVKRYDLFQKAVDLIRAKGRAVAILKLSAGTYPHEQMPIVLNACDVVTLTSDTEGSPMIVKEAMACNVPIVSVDVGDVAQVIGGTKGCLISSRDPADIAAKILETLAMGGRTNGRHQVQGFDQTATAQRILEIYDRVTRR